MKDLRCSPLFQTLGYVRWDGTGWDGMGWDGTRQTGIPLHWPHENAATPAGGEAPVVSFVVVGSTD